MKNLIMVAMLAMVSACGSSEEDAACQPYPNTCGDSSFCSEGECVPAFGRTYTVSIRDLLVADTASTGDAWDADESGPDPMIIVTLDGVVILETEIVTDSFGVASFATTATFELVEGASMEMTAIDADEGGPGDVIMTCVRDPVTSDSLALPGACNAGGSQEGSEMVVAVTLAE